MAYNLLFARSAAKELAAIPEPYQSSILDKIESLEHNPYPSGVKKIAGTKRAWRIRIGSYRVIYEVDEAAKTVDISGIGHRQSIYKK